MSSRRKRKTERKNIPPEIIEDARRRIDSGESKRSVANSLGMPESSLRKRLRYSHVATKLGRFDTTFSLEVEKDFKNYILKMDDMFFGLTPKNLRHLAYEFAERNKIPHRFNKGTKMAGKEWFRGFKQRNPDISLRKPTSTSIARAMGFNRPQCERFFINLTSLMDKYQFPPNAIYNMDETGISTVPNTTPRVLTQKGKRSVNKISSAERGTNVTVVNAISATGHYVPPAFIFGRKRMRAELLDGAPTGSIAMISDTSFINAELFLEWLTHFRDHVKPTQAQPILLILDNHVSHTTIAAIEFYRANNIVALTLPPHSSHKMQPLDRGFHTVLKKFYASECEKWLRNHPGRAVTVYQIAAIFTPAFYQTATVQRAVDTFKTTGIYPYNPDVFTDADFLASTVAERENEAATVTIEEPQETENSQDICITAVQLNENNIENEASVNIEESSSPKTDNVRKVLSNKTFESTLKAPISVPGCSKDPDLISISELSPFPKSMGKRSFTRKHKKSEIISSSPYKEEIEKQIEERAKPKVKKIKLEETQKKSENKKCGKQKNAPSSKKGKKPVSNKSNKSWKCVGCNEPYVDPPTEDWIECSQCKNWWHENCTSYDGFGLYNCDICNE